ncbi:MAG TPA: acyl-CoA dehydrogenase [Acetobacteraceae bacterium]|nr:acyl-CoA dehydrogenase [Acetobacteraceae bacterium]
MISYAPPVSEMRFVLEDIAGLASLASLPGYESATPDTVGAVLDQAAELARDVIAPLNTSGDREGARLDNGVVRTPAGFRDAYRAFIVGGWGSLPFPEEIGGQGLPLAVSAAVSEMWNAANLSFALCPLLTSGAADALEHHGSKEQKALYLPRLVSGEWTGTMNLTEPQAGSDVGALKTRAVKQGDHYRITGQKIFITYGEHDLAENIIHLVLARTPGSPPGTRGISLFLVPKFLPDASGAPGQRNDVRCVGLEHKLGIHASPTAVLSFGDSEGAIGFLVGEEHRGMACMFTMMNNARLNVGVQGIAISERAYQQARDYARSRMQGVPIGHDGPAPIVWHPDVRRMLLLMRSRTEAARALGYFAAASLDIARRSPDPAARAQALARAELLVPMVKAWSTDLGVENASLAVQVHGGMGFIEETGAAQHYRDARILPIYEGTNGIQALDLLGRKLMRDNGAAAHALIAEMRALDMPGEDLAAFRPALSHGIDAVEAATAHLLGTFPRDPAQALAGATPYLTLFSTVAGGWLMAKAAMAASVRLRRGEGDVSFLKAKLQSALFYIAHVLPQAAGLLSAVVNGTSVTAFDPDLL